MKKRILTLILALVTCLSLIPTAAAAGQIVWVDYDEVEAFQNGRALAAKDDKSGYIDVTGKELAPFQSITKLRREEKVTKLGISDGLQLIRVSKDYNHVTYGYEDLEGNRVIDAEFLDARPFYNGRAAVRKPNAGWSFIDKEGKEIEPIEYIEVGVLSEGLLSVMNNKGKWGYVNADFEPVLPFEYDGAGNFIDGYAVVMKIDKYQRWKYGVVDKTGKEVVPIEYDVLQGFFEGLAQVQKDGKLGYIDLHNNEVLPLGMEYNLLNNFHDGRAVCGKLNPPDYDFDSFKYGYIDKSGNEVIPRIYDDADDFSEGLAKVGVGEKDSRTYGLIDTAGNVVVPLVYEDVMYSEGVAVVKQDGKYGIMQVYPNAAATTPANLAYASTQEVEVDGEKITFQCYALKDANGNDTNYIKLRDLADILNGTAAQFEVGWNGSITITTGKAYTKNGTEQNTPFSGNRAYEKTAVTTLVNGSAVALDTFQLKDDNGGGYTYYKLRDLGNALGITVDWSAERGIYIETA